MANEKRLIELDALIDNIDWDNDLQKWKLRGEPEDIPTVDAVEVVQFNTLKSLVNGEWVDCKLIQEALGIDFSTGLKMFDFSRTAKWNPAPLNGQEITTEFRLKNAVVHGRWEFSRTTTVEKFAVVKCSNCGHEAFAIASYVKEGHYCPNCGAKMDGDGNA